MKIKKVDTYKISILASLALLYLLVTDSFHWLAFVAFGIIVLERAVVAFLLWMVTRMQKEMAKKLMEAISQAQATGQPIQAPFDQEDQ